MNNQLIHKLQRLTQLTFCLLVSGSSLVATQVNYAPPTKTRYTNIYTENNLKDTQDSSKVHPITTYHVSCQSDKPTGLYGEDNLGGVVLYLYDGKSDWRLNNVHCKTGYIILKKTESVKQEQSGCGQVHGDVYKSVFKEEPNNKVIGSGFAYLAKDKEGKDEYCRQWRFNSFFNNDTWKDDFHQEGRKMQQLEQKWVMKAIENWVTTGKQNTTVTDKLFLTTTDNIKPLSTSN